MTSKCHTNVKQLRCNNNSTCGTVGGSVVATVGIHGDHTAALAAHMRGVNIRAVHQSVQQVRKKQE